MTITKADYENLLQANERELWAQTERNGKLCKLINDALWPRAAFTMAADMRVEIAAQLAELGCEVDA